MSRYIDIEPLEKEGWYMARVYNDSLTSQTYETKKLKDFSIADVVEVVRCKDCKYSVEHYDTDGNVPYWICKNWDSGTDADGFCYEAERK